MVAQIALIPLFMVWLVLSWQAPVVRLESPIRKSYGGLMTNFGLLMYYTTRTDEVMAHIAEHRLCPRQAESVIRFIPV